MLEKLKGYAQVAAILGSPYLHHTIANDFLNPDNVTPYKDEFFKRGIELLKKSGFAGYYGIKYGAPDDDSSIIEESLNYVNSLL